ncbi:hypothetical protein [Thalassospira xiamenensis]|nr:hypothetical protein [Thalassospira xiamenensis]
MKSHDIIACLRSSYVQPQWAFFTEVTDGTGAASRRRIDGLAVNMWPSQGLEFRAFEVKVSKNDLCKELKNPQKSEAIAQYCNTFYLVTPKKLADDFSLPPRWGLIECDEKGRSKIIKKAHYEENPVELTREFIASILRAAAKVSESQVNDMLRLERNKLHSEMEQRVQNEARRRTESNRRLDEVNAQLLEGISSACGKNTQTLLYDKSFLDAVGVVYRIGLRSGWSGLGRLLELLSQVSKSATALHSELEKHTEELRHGEITDLTDRRIIPQPVKAKS